MFGNFVRGLLCKLSSTICLFPLVALTPEALSQEPSSDTVAEPQYTEVPNVEELAELSLEELLEVPVDTVYTASRYEQKLSEAPASVTVITSEDIRKHGYRTLAEILRSIRGLYVTYDRNYYYLGVRGFGLPADYNTRVLILIDGHRLNDSVYGSALIGTEFPLDVALIEKIEFVRGPSSSLYGDGAFFGVLNIFTRDGRRTDGVEVSSSAGSFGTYQGRITYGERLDNGLEFVLSATAFDSEGQDLKFSEFDDPTTNSGYAEGADGETYFDLFSKVALHDFALQAAYNYREKFVPTGSFGTVFNSDKTRTIDERFYVNLKYEHTFESEFDVMARVFYDYYRYLGDYEFDYSEDATPFLVINQDDTHGEWWGAELQGTKTLFDRLKLIAGGEIRDYFRQDQKNRDRRPRFTYLDDERDDLILGAYLQGDLSILDNLRLNGGVRYDHYENFGDTVNPRVGLLYSPFESTTFKLLFGRAFRAPTAFELYYEDGGFTAKANPDLDPETIYTYEIVYEQRFLEHYRLTISGFHYDIDDLIVQETDPADDLAVFRNADEVSTDGIEVELGGRLPSGLSGRLSYSYQETRSDETGRRLTNSPEHLVKLNLVQALSERKLFAGLEVQYTSERKTLGGSEADDFVLVNITLLHRNLVEGLEVSASVYNLLNVKYDDPGGAEHVQDRIEQDGTSFGLKLTYSF